MTSERSLAISRRVNMSTFIISRPGGGKSE
jgi:hypothetical protein